MTPQTEIGLQQSWLTGEIMSAALCRPVKDARMVSGVDEANVRKLRDSLQSVFVMWRNEKGELPDGDFGGLLGNPYAGKPIEECPPYACMGNRWADYADLLAKLTAEQYPPLIELEALTNNLHTHTKTLPDNIPRLPVTDTKPGMQRILAALILSEAAAGNVESAAKAHWELSRIREENERRTTELFRSSEKHIHALALSAVKSHQGYKHRDDYQDKPDCQAIAKVIWEKNPDMTKADLVLRPEIARYAKKYSGKNTLSNWLSEIDPRPSDKKRGRKKGKR